MTPRQLIRETAKQFQAAGVPDALLDASLLLAHLTGMEPMALRLDEDTQLAEDILRQYAQLARRRCQREPLQYLTGEVVFLGRVFHVDSRVLIPRPETELLVELAASELKKHGAGAKALDLCCGSGCIGVSLAL
ncbi:MAG: hypothetical protein Q4C54_02730 [Clostridia bacterium]|nr:hypothetical protein [Clostridia bacterium]